MLTRIAIILSSAAVINTIIAAEAFARIWGR
jgi:hypothetical protein